MSSAYQIVKMLLIVKFLKMLWILLMNALRGIITCLFVFCCSAVLVKPISGYILTSLLFHFTGKYGRVLQCEIDRFCGHQWRVWNCGEWASHSQYPSAGPPLGAHTEHCQQRQHGGSEAGADRGVYTLVPLCRCYFLVCDSLHCDQVFLGCLCNIP